MPLSTQLEELSNSDTRELRKLYEAEIGHPPPPRLSRGLLLSALGYRLQAARLGDLSVETRRRLSPARLGRQRDSARQLRPGMQLLREWNGRVNIVEVLDRGFRWNENQFQSLSAVAHAITGTKWSGPRFFGLEKEAKK